MKKVASHALGCKVNQYESEAIAELFAQRGYEIVNIDESADIYVINTCTVTNFGDKKSRQLIRKVKRQNPNAIVAAIGCYAQTQPEKMKEVDGVNLIIGTKGRKDIVDAVEEYSESMGIVSTVGDISREHYFEHLSVQNLAGRTRAYMKIQDGCSQFCTYCIIPYARGPVRSRGTDDILEEVRKLSDNGFKEIVLTGIHVASYGKDLIDTTLIDVIGMVQKIENIDRVRFSSIEPNIVTEEFASELSKMNKVCDHFHLSLQSGCDRTLKRMNRKYNTSQYAESVEILRRFFPDVAITTDIIAGFPDETDDDFEESILFAEKIGFSKIHAFPYSPKEGTPAAKMPNQILNSIKNERTSRLISLSDKMANDYINSFVGKTMKVLYETEVSDGVYEGYTSNYIRVHTSSKLALTNKIIETVIVSAENEKAIGEIQL